MKKKNSGAKALAAKLAVACIMAFGLSMPAKADYPVADDDSTIFMDFQGAYHQVNNDLSGDIMLLDLHGDDVFLGSHGLFDVNFAYSGKATNPLIDGYELSFDVIFNPEPGIGGETNIPAHLTLALQPNGLYELTVDLKKATEAPIAGAPSKIEFYKGDGFRIDGIVPAKIGKEVTIAGLIKAITPYVFTPEMLATRHYLMDHSQKCDDETIVQDERNAYLSYAWGPGDRYMECKYWLGEGGNVLLVVNVHDGTYQYPQQLRFFKFNPKRNEVQELRSALSPKWPLEDYSDNDGIIYQVRYYSNGLVALVPQKNGDSFDTVTLKFNGNIFE